MQVNYPQLIFPPQNSLLNSFFVKIDNTNVETVCVSSKHNNELANNIMRLIQNNYKDNDLHLLHQVVLQYDKQQNS